MGHIVKRHGHIEQYDQRKVYASVYAAALNGHYHEQDAERVAAEVAEKVSVWIRNKPVVKAEDIRHRVLATLQDPEIALIYKHHLDVC